MFALTIGSSSSSGLVENLIGLSLTPADILFLQEWIYDVMFAGWQIRLFIPLTSFKKILRKKI